MEKYLLRSRIGLVVLEGTKDEILDWIERHSERAEECWVQCRIGRWPYPLSIQEFLSNKDRLSEGAALGSRPRLKLNDRLIRPEF